MEFLTFITEQALILVPVLYLLGMFLKSSEVPDKYIPVSLLVAGVAISMFLLGFSVQSFIQGVLVAGAAVFANELIKQNSRED